MSSVMKLRARGGEKLVILEQLEAVVRGGEGLLEEVFLQTELILIFLPLPGVVPDAGHVTAELPHRDTHISPVHSLPGELGDILRDVFVKIHLPLLPELGQYRHSDALTNAGYPHHTARAWEKMK